MPRGACPANASTSASIIISMVISGRFPAESPHFVPPIRCKQDGGQRRSSRCATTRTCRARIIDCGRAGRNPAPARTGHPIRACAVTGPAGRLLPAPGDTPSEDTQHQNDQDNHHQHSQQPTTDIHDRVPFDITLGTALFRPTRSRSRARSDRQPEHEGDGTTCRDRFGSGQGRAPRMPYIVRSAGHGRDGNYAGRRPPASRHRTGADTNARGGRRRRGTGTKDKPGCCAGRSVPSPSPR